MNLVIDWGNSSVKTGWFDGDTLLSTGHFTDPDGLLAAMSDPTTIPPDHVLVSSTSRSAADIRAGFGALPVQVLDAQLPVPIGNAYETPATLGTDRLAAAVGATVRFPGRDCLVLDLGTCLTADWVDAGGTFRGGLIGPGLHMRFRAMHTLTARLPLVEALPPGADWPALTAGNTREAMRSGVLNGLVFELDGLIGAYREKQPELAVLVCGGDGPLLASRLKAPIFAVPELVLIGLNRILRYNVENLQADTPDVNA